MQRYFESFESSVKIKIRGNNIYMEKPPKTKRCPKGTQRNKKTRLCEKKTNIKSNSKSRSKSKSKSNSNSNSKSKATQKVLVLCQRKEGKCDRDGLLVQDLVVPKIQKYLREHLNVGDHTTEYLAFLNDHNMEEGDKVDFNLQIRADSNKFETFLKTHKKQYSVIMLNTCPFNHINFQCISDMLDDAGVVVLSQVGCDSIYNTKLFNISPAILESTQKSNLLDFFQYNEIKGYYTKINIDWAEFY